MEKTKDYKKYVRSYSELSSALDSLYLYKLLYDRQLLFRYQSWLPQPALLGECADYEPDIVTDALFSLSEAVWDHYSQDGNEIYAIYFSSPAIMEYYRLCREYSQTCGIPLGSNPYMQRAAEYVRNRLEQGCYSCSYHLQTKIHHAWASGIVFRMWPDFTSLLALLVMMGRIFSFYEQGLEHLKHDLSNLNRRLPEHQKEAA